MRSPQMQVVVFGCTPESENHFKPPGTKHPITWPKLSSGAVRPPAELKGCLRGEKEEEAEQSHSHVGVGRERKNVLPGGVRGSHSLPGRPVVCWTQFSSVKWKRQLTRLLGRKMHKGSSG